MAKDQNKYTDAELAEARAVAEKELGRPMTDAEMRDTFGRSIPHAGATDRSSRTIRTDELPPADTSQSGRHAGPGRIARALGFGGKKKG